MSEIENLTEFAHGSVCAYGLDDRAHVVHCLAGRFRMPAPGRSHQGELMLIEQRAPPMADVHWGDPATTSLKYAGQGTVVRPGAEVYVAGCARAPGDRSVTSMRVSLRVGPCTKAIEVTGTRVWRRGALGLRPSAPEPFTRMPLRYERSYGGTVLNPDGEIIKQEPHNPVGIGLYKSAGEAVDMPLPDLEDPTDRVTSWNDRVAPVGFGPIPGSWQPRLRFAGTFDSAWIASRAPLWPRDTDPQHFCAAAAGLSAPGPFHGGEPVALEGFSPQGTFQFSLPTFRVIAKNTYTDGTSRCALLLDGVLIETDEHVITLFWRRAVPLGEGARRLLRTTLRLLDPWEDPVE